MKRLTHYMDSDTTTREPYSRSGKLWWDDGDVFLLQVLGGRRKAEEGIGSKVLKTKGGDKHETYSKNARGVREGGEQEVPQGQERCVRPVNISC